jgi:hypothetical protein
LIHPSLPPHRAVGVRVDDQRFDPPDQRAIADDQLSTRITRVMATSVPGPAADAGALGTVGIGCIHPGPAVPLLLPIAARGSSRGAPRPPACAQASQAMCACRKKIGADVGGRTAPRPHHSRWRSGAWGARACEGEARRRSVMRAPRTLRYVENVRPINHVVSFARAYRTIGAGDLGTAAGMQGIRLQIFGSSWCCS